LVFDCFTDRIHQQSACWSSQCGPHSIFLTTPFAMSYNTLLSTCWMPLEPWIIEGTPDIGSLHHTCAALPLIAQASNLFSSLGPHLWHSPH
jgi:hypothetical protein